MIRTRHAGASVMSIPYRGIDGIEAWAIAEAPPLRVVISRERAPEPTGAVADEWVKMCARNPRLFDGPVLSVLGFDPARNEVHCRRDGYQRLSVQPSVMTGVRQLSVTGVLMARDASGREHVLIGRRGGQTRIYQGMWEIGPSGGLTPPHASVEELSREDLVRMLDDEVAEEVGLSVSHGRVVAIVRDHAAHSDDVVIVCDMGALEDVDQLGGPANWEYSETRWLPRDTAAAFDAGNAGEIIAASRAVFRVLGWIDET